MKEFDLEKARRDTPGCEQVLHFNNAGAALMPRQVLEAVMDHLRLEASVGGYEAAERSHERIERFYESAARLIGSAPGEIAFVENATRAWDMAFYAIPFKPGDRILTAMAEYASNYIAFLQVCRKTGARVEVIPNDSQGQVSLDALKEMLDERVRLVAITHVPTNGGLVNPVSEVGQLLRSEGIFYLVDACQSVGQMPVNVAEIGCDFLSATGRKFLRGPRGTGFLYVRRERIQDLDPPFLDLHAARWVRPDQYEVRTDARRFECWEASYAGKLGLAEAVDYALGWDLEVAWGRIRTLSEALRAGLRRVPGVKVHDLGALQCGIVSFSLEGRKPEEVRRCLLDRHINVSVSGREATLLDMESRNLPAVVRASLHYYNTEQEVEGFCGAVASLR